MQFDIFSSGSDAGGEQAMPAAIPRAISPAARNSGREIGAGETRIPLEANKRMSPRRISRRKAGASDATSTALPKMALHSGELSGRKVGGEQTKVAETPSEGMSAVQISGASVSGDEAHVGPNTKAVPPRRKSPGRKAGADQALPQTAARDSSPDPQPPGSTAGASPARRVLQPNVLEQETQTSEETRGDESHMIDELHSRVALIAELVQLGRARRDWMKTRVGIELRAIAICRRFTAGDKDAAMVLWKAVKESEAPADLVFAVSPLLGPIGILKEQEVKVDRMMTKLAGRHDMAPWAKSIRGFGHAGLAKIIAECGDIGTYRNPSCVWKRMGLAVIEGGRQRRVPGAAALDHGYNAERRSVMWNVGGAVIGGMGRGPRPLVGEDIEARDDLTAYQRLFVRRLRFEAERDPENHARPPVANKETGVLKESFSAHAANRAKRYVEKRLLRDLWIAWRRAGQTSIDGHAPGAGSPTPSAA